MKPLVSVIIPTFNRGYCLARTLDSVLAQTYATTEIIVIDDGSTDDTKQLVTRYQQVKYVYQTQQGVSSARNAGIQTATGEWIALLDSDDEWKPEKLSRQIDALSNSDYRLCHTDETWIRNGVRVNPMHKYAKSGGNLFEACLPLCCISPSSALIHRAIFDEVGLFDTTLPACEDYDLWLRICARHPALYLNESLLIKYGGHEDQLSTRYWGMDRFRIRALQKIIDSGTLNTKQQLAALSTCREKINIYLQGAKKRNKQQDITHYENLLEQYS